MAISKIRRAGLIAILLVAGGLTACHRDEVSEYTKRAQERETKIVGIAKELDASVDWEFSQHLLGSVFSIEIEDALSSLGDRPLLLRDLEVEDVRRENGDYVIRFARGSVFPSFRSEVKLDLVCDERAARLAATSSANDWAVVATLDRVRKVDSYRAYVGAQDAVAIGPQNRFVLTGRCIRLIPPDAPS